MRLPCSPIYRLKISISIHANSIDVVVGAKEQETRTVNIRNRDDLATQKMGELIPLEKALERLTKLRDERGLENKIDMSE